MKRKTFQLALGIALFSASIPFTKVNTVKAEGLIENKVLATSSREKALLDRIEVEIENNKVLLDTSFLSAEERRSLVYVTESETEGNLFSRDGYTYLSKEEVGNRIALKVRGKQEERVIAFSLQETPSKDEISYNDEMTRINVGFSNAEYRVIDKESPSNWLDIDGGSFDTQFLPKHSALTFEIRKKAVGVGNQFTFASESVSIPLDRSQILKEKIDAVNFVAEGDVNGKLYHVNSEMEYSVDPRIRWNRIYGDTASVSSGLSSHTGIVIRYRDNPSTERTIQVFQGTTKNHQNVIRQENGIFMDIPNGFEVKKDGKGIWEKVENGTYIATETGSYRFRMAATENTLASSLNEDIIMTVTRLSGGENQPGRREENRRNEAQGNAGGAAGGQANAGGGAPAAGLSGKVGGNVGGSTVAVAGGVQASKKSEEKKEELKKTEDVKSEQKESSKDIKESVTKEAEEKAETANTAPVVEVKAEKTKTKHILSITLNESLFGEQKEVKLKVMGDKEGYSVKIKKKDMEAGKKVKVFEEKAGKLVLVNAKTLTISEEGLNVSLRSGKNYVVLSLKEAKKAEEKILKNLKLEKTNIKVASGKTAKINLSKGFDKSNVKKITYSYNGKKLEISKNGEIKVKTKAKNLVVKVKVTLKNNKKKEFKIKVSSK